MVKWLILLLFSTISFAKDPIRVVVLDTGLNPNDIRFKFHLCESGHRDFTNSSIYDNEGHGTHVVGSIVKYAEKSNYCIIIVKFFNTHDTKDMNTMSSLMAMFYIKALEPDIVNFSGGGGGFDLSEYLLLKSSKKTIFVVAAGNQGKNLDSDCYYYPACYNLDNILVVGALGSNGKIWKSSNYGSVVDYYEHGENIMSTTPNGSDETKTGTSMATSITTGKLIKLMDKER